MRTQRDDVLERGLDQARGNQAPSGSNVRTGGGVGYTIARPTFERQFAIDAFAALPPAHLMIGLLELDVTDAEARIAQLHRAGTRVSLFAFLLRSIAVAISEHPELNQVRHRRAIVRFDDVDVNVPMEVTTADGKFPRQVVIRRAQQRSPAQIYAELEQARLSYARTGDTGGEDRWARRMMRLFGWLPQFLRIRVMRRLIQSAFTVKRRAGTTLVTSVGKFSSVPGFAFSFTTGPRAAAFAVGGVVQKPWNHQGRVVIRSVLSLSIMVNHDLVDGAPAARFANRLQELIEKAQGLPPEAEPVTAG